MSAKTEIAMPSGKQQKTIPPVLLRKGEKVYLDHAANTPVFPAVLDAMLPWYDNSHVGNPNSIHTSGRQAKDAIETARKQVAEMINAEPEEIYFTSGGTESNNIFIHALDSEYMYNTALITTLVEHESILAPAKRHLLLYKHYIPVNSDGVIDLDEFKKEVELLRLNPDIFDSGIAASIIWVNNELGSINPMRELGEICDKYNIIFHSDAIQAAGHVPINVKGSKIDALSLAGHKFGAPLGTGVLYLSNNIQKKLSKNSRGGAERWREPLMYGGGQENGIRPGTQNVPGIVGLGKAAEIVTENLSKWQAHYRKLRDLFIEEFEFCYSCTGKPFQINYNPKDCSSSIISLTLPGVHSESLLVLLDINGVYVSAGAACSAGSSNVSHVLTAIGLTEDEAASTIRISLGYDTTEDQVSFAAQKISECAQQVDLINSLS